MLRQSLFRRCIYIARGLATLPDHKQIIMPKVSPTMTAGRLVDWKKHEGEAFLEGEDIADVESDKATMPISAREDGYIARIFVPPDTADIPLGQLLAITVEEEGDIAAFKDYTPASFDPSPEAAVSQDRSSEGRPETWTSDVRKYAGPVGPAIMRILKEFPGINLDGIRPSGPKGRVLKGDVLAAIEDGTAFSDVGSPEAEGTGQAKASIVQTRQDSVVSEDASEERQNYTDVAVSSMRRSIAKRLVVSKTSVPHRYVSAQYYLDEVLRVRKRLNDMEPSARISVNDFIIRAVGIALRRVPEMNVWWDNESGSVVKNERVDVSMAVAIPGGLITPIVTEVDRRGLVEIANMTKDLVARAKDGSLAAEEFEGGSFSISNLGMYGICEFSAIINPPQSGILAVGSGIERAIIGDDGKISGVTQGVATLSSDARAIEEETAGRFLKEFCKCVSEPETMLA